MKEVKKSDPLAGLNEGFNHFKDEATNVIENVSDMTLRAFDGMTDALTRFVLTGKAGFKDFAVSVINQYVCFIMLAFEKEKSNVIFIHHLSITGSCSISYCWIFSSNPI
ncbi:Phage-related minor tail protein [[Pasteurella] mairii]|uniref:Phage-related minor tail protein n=1 Tax=[Pasteurella] mairii TaxID=757 RepID=A0A379B4S1_9PAST|nr:Phage-related minor tail protein [[Pasteurella] mairii]